MAFNVALASNLLRNEAELRIPKKPRKIPPLLMTVEMNKKLLELE